MAGLRLGDDFRTLALWETFSTRAKHRISRDNASRLKLAQPILMTKAIDPGKLAFVVGDKNEGLKKAQTAEAAGKGAQAQAEASQIAGKSNPLSPLYSPTEAALNLGTAPGAAQIQTGQTAQAGRVAGAQAGARFPYEMQLERVRQQVAQSQQVMQPDIPMDEMSMSDYLKARKRGR